MFLTGPIGVVYLLGGFINFFGVVFILFGDLITIVTRIGYHGGHAVANVGLLYTLNNFSCIEGRLIYCLLGVLFVVYYSG